MLFEIDGEIMLYVMNVLNLVIYVNGLS